MSEFKEFHKNNHSIAQLKELQVVRRLAFLEDQKVRREEQFSFLRDLKQIVPNIKLTKKQTKAEKYLQRECNGVPTQPKPRYNNSFRDILMLSEWMMATPEDLEEYLLIPCPKGSRVSVSVGEWKSHYSKSVTKVTAFFNSRRCTRESYWALSKKWNAFHGH